MEKKRDYIGMFDVAKGILLFIIVLVHHYSFFNGGMRPYMEQAAGKRMLDWGGLCVGLFFVIAGYQSRPARSLQEYAKRQARELLIPYFAAILLASAMRFLIYYLQNGQIRIQEFSTLVAGGLYGAVQNVEVAGVWAYSVIALWFLPTFFLSGLIFRALSGIHNRRAAACCIWGLSVIAIHMPDAYRFQFPWFLVQSCAVLGLMETGRIIKEKGLLRRRLPAWFVAGSLVLYVGCHIFSECNIASNIWRAGALDYLAVCCMSTVCLRGYVKSGMDEKPMLFLFAYTGMYSMLFLLLHGTGLLVIPWEAELGRRIAELAPFLPVWITGSIVFMLRYLGLATGCYAWNYLIRLRYKLQKSDKETRV